MVWAWEFIRANLRVWVKKMEGGKVNGYGVEN